MQGHEQDPLQSDVSSTCCKDYHQDKAAGVIPNSPVYSTPILVSAYQPDGRRGRFREDSISTQKLGAYIIAMM